MNTQFDELTKGLAQSVTRRAALKRFGVGLAGVALASFGLTNQADAGRTKPPTPCGSDANCRKNQYCYLAPYGGPGFCVSRRIAIN